MKISTAIIVACVAMLGAADMAFARPHSHFKHHRPAKAAIHNNQSQGGVSVSTGDVNGDGTNDVAVAPKPRKPKSAK